MENSKFIPVKISGGPVQNTDADTSSGQQPGPPDGIRLNRHARRVARTILNKRLKKQPMTAAELKKKFEGVALVAQMHPRSRLRG